MHDCVIHNEILETEIKNLGDPKFDEGFGVVEDAFLMKSELESINSMLEEDFSNKIEIVVDLEDEINSSCASNTIEVNSGDEVMKCPNVDIDKTAVDEDMQLWNEPKFVLTSVYEIERVLCC